MFSTGYITGCWDVSVAGVRL